MIISNDTCQILINNQIAQEYKQSTRILDGINISSCYIASSPGSNFSISYSYKGTSPTGVYCDVYVDGNEITGKHTNKLEKHWEFKGKRISGDRKHKLKFQKYSGSDTTGSPVCEEDGKLGVIVVKLGYAELGDFYHGEEVNVGLEPPVTDVSTKTADHHLVLGEEFKSKIRMKHVKRSRPIRIFEFYYRSKEMLKLMGIVPDVYMPFDSDEDDNFEDPESVQRDDKDDDCGFLDPETFRKKESPHSTSLNDTEPGKGIHCPTASSESTINFAPSNDLKPVKDIQTPNTSSESTPGTQDSEGRLRFLNAIQSLFNETAEDEDESFEKHQKREYYEDTDDEYDSLYPEPIKKVQSPPERPNDTKSVKEMMPFPDSTVQPVRQIPTHTRLFLKAIQEELVEDESMPSIKREIELVDLDKPAPSKRFKASERNVVEIIHID